MHEKTSACFKKNISIFFRKHQHIFPKTSAYFSENISIFFLNISMFFCMSAE